MPFTYYHPGRKRGRRERARVSLKALGKEKENRPPFRYLREKKRTRNERHFPRKKEKRPQAAWSPERRRKEKEREKRGEPPYVKQVRITTLYTLEGEERPGGLRSFGQKGKGEARGAICSSSFTTGRRRYFSSFPLISSLGEKGRKGGGGSFFSVEEKGRYSYPGGKSRVVMRRERK